MHAHTRTLTHTHARAHTRTHVHTHTHTHTESLCKSRFRLEWTEDCRNDYLAFEDETRRLIRFCGSGQAAITGLDAHQRNVFDSEFCCMC